MGGAPYNEQACAEKFGWAAGVAFQIADDYLDIFAVSEEFGKEVYKDIIEQKLGNFVIVNAIRLLGDDDASKLKGYLTDSNLSDEERISNCVPLIEQSKVKEYTMKVAENWSSKAKMDLSTIEFKNEDLRYFLEKIADFSVRRAF